MNVFRRMSIKLGLAPPSNSPTSTNTATTTTNTTTATLSPLHDEFGDELLRQTNSSNNQERRASRRMSLRKSIGKLFSGGGNHSPNSSASASSGTSSGNGDRNSASSSNSFGRLSLRKNSIKYKSGHRSGGGGDSSGGGFGFNVLTDMLQWYDQGVQQLEVERDYAGAIRNFDKVLQVEPLFLSALIQRAIAHCKANNELQWKKALEDVEKALATTSSTNDATNSSSSMGMLTDSTNSVNSSSSTNNSCHTKIQCWAIKAQCLIGLNQQEEALDTYQTIVKEGYCSSDSRTLLTRKEQSLLSKEELKLWQQRWKQLVDVIVQRCLLLIQMNRSDEAFPYYCTTVEELSKIRLSHKDENGDEQEEESGSDNEGNMEQLLILNGRATVLSHLKRSSEAMIALNNILEMDPGNAEAWTLKGQLYEKSGRLDAAIECFTTLLDMMIDREDPDTFYKRASVYFKLGEYNRARSDLNEAIKLNEHATDYRVMRGMVSLEMEMFSEAISDFTRVLNKHQGNLSSKQYIELLSNRSKCYMHMDMLSLALADAEKALEADPSRESSQDAVQELRELLGSEDKTTTVN